MSIALGQHINPSPCHKFFLPNYSYRDPYFQGLLYVVIVDLKAAKDTKEILAKLNKAFTNKGCGMGIGYLS